MIGPHALRTSFAAYQLKTHRALLDGEVVVQAPEDLQDFSALAAIGQERPDEHLVSYVFDILYLDGFDLRSCSRRRTMGDEAI